MHIDERFMDEVGLGGMPEAEKRAFMEHAEEELEVRVGQRIGMGLSDAQMLEFGQIEDEAEATAWLERYAPNFREIVAQVYQAFKRELSDNRQRILG